MLLSSMTFFFHAMRHIRMIVRGWSTGCATSTIARSSFFNLLGGLNRIPTRRVAWIFALTVWIIIGGHIVMTFSRLSHIWVWMRVLIFLLHLLELLESQLLLLLVNLMLSHSLNKLMRIGHNLRDQMMLIVIFKIVDLFKIFVILFGHIFDICDEVFILKVESPILSIVVHSFDIGRLLLILLNLQCTLLNGNW